jgi:hypothetical protein
MANPKKKDRTESPKQDAAQPKQMRQPKPIGEEKEINYSNNYRTMTTTKLKEIAYQRGIWSIKLGTYRTSVIRLLEEFDAKQNNSGQKRCSELLNVVTTSNTLREDSVMANTPTPRYVSYTPNPPAQNLFKDFTWHDTKSTTTGEEAEEGISIYLKSSSQFVRKDSMMADVPSNPEELRNEVPQAMIGGVSAAEFQAMEELKWRKKMNKIEAGSRELASVNLGPGVVYENGLREFPSMKK